MRGGRSRSGSQDLAARLATHVLVGDGAMGTLLHAGGISLDRSLPELNLSRAERVRAIHRAYIAAGADIIETNTFGASRLRLARYGLAAQAGELNRAGAAIAREARDQSGASDVLVGGSISPATPAGGHRVSARELREAFREQIEALCEGGVDLLLFETFGSLAELVEAIGVARTVGDVPSIAQMTFVEDGRTLGGDSPEDVATTLSELGVVAIGANCTLGPQGLLEVLSELSQWTSLPLAAQPNAGPPTLTDGQFHYTASDPAYFGRQARRFVELGASLVGGCCGTTPVHIEAIASAVHGLQRTAPVAGHGRSRVDVVSPGREPLSERRDATQSALLEVIKRDQLVVACELPPPPGAEIDRAIGDAELLRSAGCDALVIGPVGSTRVQASPASIALLVQQRVPDLEVILTATTWEKSLMWPQAAASPWAPEC